MLVVLAVLGVALGLVAARGPPRGQALDLRAAAGQLAGDLRAGRARAVATGRPVALAADAGGWRVGDGPARRLPPGLSLTLAAPPGGLRFLPDGASTGGRVAVAAGAVRRVVAVDRLTGRVGVEGAVDGAGAGDAR